MSPNSWNTSAIAGCSPDCGCVVLVGRAQGSRVCGETAAHAGTRPVWRALLGWGRGLGQSCLTWESLPHPPPFVPTSQSPPVSGSFSVRKLMTGSVFSSPPSPTRGSCWKAVFLLLMNSGIQVGNWKNRRLSEALVSYFASPWSPIWPCRASAAVTSQWLRQQRGLGKWSGFFSPHFWSLLSKLKMLRLYSPRAFSRVYRGLIQGPVRRQKLLQ